MMGNALSEMVKSFRTQMRDVMEAINALASSSNQIATITVQLASGSEETAVASNQNRRQNRPRPRCGTCRN